MAKGPMVVVYPKVTKEEQEEMQAGCATEMMKLYLAAFLIMSFFYLARHPELWAHILLR